MSDSIPNYAVRDALLAALQGRDVDGAALFNINHRALEHDGQPDPDAIDYWVHKHSTPVIGTPITTTPDPSQGVTAQLLGGGETGREAYARRHPTPDAGATSTGTQQTGRDVYARRHGGRTT